MAAAIDNFKLMQVEHKMAILGKMGELGDVSDEEHQKVVNMLVEAGFDEVWLVGAEFQNAVNGQCSMVNGLHVPFLTSPYSTMLKK